MEELLFVYGTLMVLEIRRNLLDRKPQVIRASLAGFARRAVLHERYPAIIPEPQASVHGLLLQLCPIELLMLDTYEGGEYTRGKVLVNARGKQQHAWTYIWNGSQDRLAQHDWDFEAFRSALVNSDPDFRQ